MGRRSLISMTAIRRMAASYDRRQREIHNNFLINSQGDNEKERSPQYRLLNVEFNDISRIARIEFLQTQEYRTVQRYITQNYERYPIFSDWKIKEKIIKKTIKLTNSQLELLNENDDLLIRTFAEDIILRINKEELFPSWFVKIYLRKKLDNDLQTMEDKLNSLKDNQNYNILLQQGQIKTYSSEIVHSNKLLSKIEKKKDKSSILLNKISNARLSILKIIFSIGIYKYLVSQKRKQKIESKLTEINREIDKIIGDIVNNRKKIESCKNTINNCKNTISENETKYEHEKETKIREYDKKKLEIKPLTNTINQDESYTMLKEFNGLEYEKIIGVYVIHNKENDKYYVGQSKDVIKRIRQHFAGTVPKNSIFSEDYYTSQLANKADLFEIKIIKCETKDELDKLEKELIYEYDSWNNGYNRTSGNL